jgi:probable HAF family extracellular repeat protein
MVDLGTLPGDEIGFANAINEPGQVAGISFDPDTEIVRAVLWDKSRITDIGQVPGFPSTYAWGINNRGQVVGAGASGVYGPEWQAFLWERGELIVLPIPEGYTRSQAVAINSRGQAVGSIHTPGSTTVHAALWEDGNVLDLGVLPGDRSSGAFRY